jgi:hypothetical protein
MATSMKMTIFWDVASFSLIETDGHFRGTSPDDVGIHKYL